MQSLYQKKSVEALIYAGTAINDKLHVHLLLTNLPCDIRSMDYIDNQ